jgi:hypothetical protein
MRHERTEETSEYFPCLRGQVTWCCVRVPGMSLGIELGRGSWPKAACPFHLSHRTRGTPLRPTGAGLKASHQTGWTGIIARAMHLFATTTPEQVLELGKLATMVEMEPAVSA